MKENYFEISIFSLPQKDKKKSKNEVDPRIVRVTRKRFQSQRQRSESGCCCVCGGGRRGGGEEVWTGNQGGQGKEGERGEEGEREEGWRGGVMREG